MANVLITGAGGGFGKLTTLALRKSGHTVVGTLRDIGGRNASKAAELQAAGAVVLEMDVTSDSSVDATIGSAIEQTGRIDAVVNNAGLGVLGVQEAFTAGDLQRLFDINVFGAHRVTRAIAPHLRANGNGLVVFVSSLLGRVAIPFYGPYNASKWALEALAENYSMELSGFGVDVSVVEPGGFATSFMENLIYPGDTQRVTELGELSQAANDFFVSFEQFLGSMPAQDPQLVGQAIVDLVSAAPGKRPFRVVVDTVGMGDAVKAYNDHLAQLTAGIFGNFGISGMLERRG